jgi:glyoxylase-like metal-dependent hydrolase (beta-lactamase superfamily II)
MTELTRRHVLGHVLAGTAVASAATALTPLASVPAFAAAPAAGKQIAGYYRYKVGSLECTQVTDGMAQFPMPDGFIKNAGKDDINKALQAAYLPPDKMTVLFNPMVINTGSKLVVIDTGYGPEMYAQSKGARGQFVTNMMAAGYDPKAVDIVIISHFHPDHVNGLVSADGKSAFPNAEIKVPAPESAFWMDDGNMGKAKGGLLGAFKNNRRVMGVVAKQITKYEWNKEVVPGITAIPTVGHTPGHTSFVVASGNGKLLIQSDVTNNPFLFLRHPGWHVVYDMDGNKAEETRRKFYDMAAAEKTMIAGFHFPFPALGYVEKRGGSFELVPITWTPSL